jgi:hypothetical protein
METIPTQPSLVHYIPIATTILSAIFCGVLIRRFQFKGQGTHLLWWAGGIACYGLGTAMESSITLLGNTPMLNKWWYITGALLGGYPLAQGSVYLHLRKRTAHILSAVTVPFIILFSVLVLLSPVNLEVMEAHRPAGAVLGWGWIRYATPVINTYAVFFLIGGAAWSAMCFAKRAETANRATGNVMIAFGALLPAIGGGATKLNHVEWLYVCEFLGLVCIWMGYRLCVRAPMPAVHKPTAEPVPVTA